MQQDEELGIDPEEQAEGKLVQYMALAVMAMVAGGILFLVILPWIQRFRDEQAGEDAVVENLAAAAAESVPPEGSGA